MSGNGQNQGVGGQGGVQAGGAAKPPAKPTNMPQRGGREALEQVADADALDGVDKAILAEYAIDSTISDVKLAKLLRIDRQTIRRHVKTPAFQKAMKELLIPDTELAARVSKRALRRLERLVMSQDEGIAVRAATAATRHQWPMRVSLEAGGEWEKFRSAMEAIPEPGKAQARETKRPARRARRKG